MAEKEMATIFIFGKKYEVPAELTETASVVLVLLFIESRDRISFRLVLLVQRKLKTICISLPFLSSHL